MTKAKGETPRRQLGRVSILDRRLRSLIQKRHQTDANIAEISALEWAIPILEQYVFDTYGVMPLRVKWHKHEKGIIKSRLWARDGDICYLCDGAMVYSVATIDHVVPLAKYGKDDMSNYKLVHPLCNIQKGNMTYEQFIKSKERATA